MLQVSYVLRAVVYLYKIMVCTLQVAHLFVTGLAKTNSGIDSAGSHLS